MIKLDQQGEETPESITCWLSDFKSLWSERISYDSVLERFKKCNPLIACSKKQILSTVTTMPKNENLNFKADSSSQHQYLNVKYYISDGSDDIPVKFSWTLEKGYTQSFYETFTKLILRRMMELEKINDNLIESNRNKDQKISNLMKKLNDHNETKDVAKNFEQSSGESSFDVKKDEKKTNGHSSAGHQNANVFTAIRHPGFTCDNCGKFIVGHRYSCMECDDYDLCMSCEYSVIHTHHMMIRYAHPRDQIRAKRVFTKTKRHSNNF